MVFMWKKLRLQRPMKNPPYSRAAVGWPKMKETESLAEFYNLEKQYSLHMTVSMGLRMIHRKINGLRNGLCFIHTQSRTSTRSRMSNEEWLNSFGTYDFSSRSSYCFCQLFLVIHGFRKTRTDKWTIVALKIKLAVLCLVGKSGVTFIQRLAYILVNSSSRRQINTASFWRNSVWACDTVGKTTAFLYSDWQ